MCCPPSEKLFLLAYPGANSGLYGGVVEWSMTPCLEQGVGADTPTTGSNPVPSANL